ncbi:uncharacterized protein BO87DRAFT_407160 [Aspergillus neoniger CBS 115656]|uniref:Uncharacterized protein n=1 Tax=Aspergillus neoniger (strain CBS 115656) TaxID=1448310 RepID=A0A318YI84_ASPNB|nr:hypothetical protein BO87DRAFT_407160 [Aspergillus neoniger CBS 115656]PYH33804.1 hypothetical protein BO87DRAFT_407160 [Aspergillus neoniger CBS 115656]
MAAVDEDGQSISHKVPMRTGMYKRQQTGATEVGVTTEECGPRLEWVASSWRTGDIRGKEGGEPWDGQLGFGDETTANFRVHHKDVGWMYDRELMQLRRRKKQASKHEAGSRKGKDGSSFSQSLVPDAWHHGSISISTLTFSTFIICPSAVRM